VCSGGADRKREGREDQERADGRSGDDSASSCLLVHGSSSSEISSRTDMTPGWPARLRRPGTERRGCDALVMRLVGALVVAPALVVGAAAPGEGKEKPKPH